MVRTARRYSAAGLEAVAVVEELNEFVTFHDLEQFVQLSVSNDKAQTCLPFIETETSKEAAQ
ncbi:MAG: hypothetical protein JW942_07815 [Opitutales bacterium]|nr:hypothetical protein [Opitutales bacterium]